MLRSTFSVRLLCVPAVLALAAFGQMKYTGPTPPQKDLPYLVHGDNILATDAGTAKSEDKKNETVYTIPGDAATAKTPLASPIFVIDAAKIDATKLQLFRMDTKNGHREITFQKKGKGGAQPIRLSLTVVAGSVFRLESVESLPNGEYALTPDGSDDVFCFSVY